MAAVDGQRRFCAECGRGYLAKHATSLTCSNACRLRKSRNRRARDVAVAKAVKALKRKQKAKKGG